MSLPLDVPAEAVWPVIERLRESAALGLVALWLAVASIGLAVALANAVVVRRRGTRTTGPEWLAAALVCVGAYALARILDPLLVTLLERPAFISETAFAAVGWFEWVLLGRASTAAILPLASHPGAALALHAIGWATVLQVVRGLLVFGYQLRTVAYESPAPAFFRIVGSTTAKRADPKLRQIFGGSIAALVVLHALAGLRWAVRPLEGPAPGTWVVCGMVVWVATFSLLTRGRPSAREPKPSPADPELESDIAAMPTPLTRLREALGPNGPRLLSEPRVREPPVAGRSSDFPADIAPLVREIFEQTTRARVPWADQGSVLEHLAGCWRIDRRDGPAEVPALAEQFSLAPTLHRSAGASPHVLMVGPEGSGRTTTLMLAALHVFVDRGATSLVIVRDRPTAAAWAQTLRAALVESSARWNVFVAVAGDDLAALMLAARTPSIVVAALADLDAEVLVDERTDPFLMRLGLVVADDVDAFTGVAEMHLQLAMRRLWALLDRLHDAVYPTVLVATAARGASGLEAWANHVLAAPLQVFAGTSAPSKSRLIVRRQDLVDGSGEPVPLVSLVEACEAAAVPWHLRLAGDGRRHSMRTSALIAGGHYYVVDATRAVVVLVEGPYPDVCREAQRLRHAGRDAPTHDVVLVLAPPSDEELILHEEADDALHRELVASLPMCVPLREPKIVVQRHFDRALGREQSADALADRFGAGFVGDALASLLQSAKITRRTVPVWDARTDDVVERVWVVATVRGALGEPIDPACVGEPSACVEVVDLATSEVLVTLDGAVAPAVASAGQVFLHPRGRFRVAARAAQEGSIGAEEISTPIRTTVDHSVQLREAEELAFEVRELGGRPLHIALGYAQIEEQVVGIRTYEPGPRLVDRRRRERPAPARYGTEVCLIDFGVELADPAVDVPLVAAMRMMLGVMLRAAENLVDVEIVEHESRRMICVFDRVPGGAGFARFVGERALRELLTLTNIALERLVGPEADRLRAIHDRTPDADASRWDLAAASRLVAAALATELEPDAGSSPAITPNHGPRIEFTMGAGGGHLGRLWISRSGRSDDLLWTRHRFVVHRALGLNHPGWVAFDVAFERRAVTRARRRSAAARGTAGALLELGARAGALFEADRLELAPVRHALHRIAGDAYLEVLLALVAGIPERGEPMEPADRTPLVALTRRRADSGTKALVVASLMRGPGELALVRAPQADGDERERVLVQVSAPAFGGRTWDLRGPYPQEVAAAPEDQIIARFELPTSPIT